MRDPLFRYGPIEPVFADLRTWVDRYVRRFPDRDDLRPEVDEQPGDVVGELLASHVSGEWDLSQDEVAHLWFIGRAMGWRRTELLPDTVLEQAVPGRGERPADPPGRWVREVVLWGGGHAAGRGLPGKREFPADWSDDEVIDRAMDVAEQPSGAVELPDGLFRAFGERGGVRVGVVVTMGGQLLTAYPVHGPGVAQNPLSEEQRPVVELLESLLEVLPRDQEPRVSFEELIGVGEWTYVVENLFAMDLPWTQDQRIDLHGIAEVSGVDQPEDFLTRTG